MSQAKSAEKVVQDIRRKTRRRFSVEEKIRIVLEGGLRGEESIVALCRREGLNPNLYYRWSKEFLEAGKKRLVGDTGPSGRLSESRRIELPSGGVRDRVRCQWVGLEHTTTQRQPDGAPVVTCLGPSRHIHGDGDAYGGRHQSLRVGFRRRDQRGHDERQRHDARLLSSRHRPRHGNGGHCSSLAAVSS